MLKKDLSHNRNVSNDWLALAVSLRRISTSTDQSDFFDILACELNRFFNFDHYAVFGIKRDDRRAIRTIATDGNLAAGQANRLADAYSRKFGSRDPLIQSLPIRILAHGENCVIGRPIRQIYDEEYYSRFFETAQLADKIAFAHVAREEVIYCNFYRTNISGSFTEHERNAFSTLTPVISTIVGQVIAEELKKMRHSVSNIGEILAHLFSDQHTPFSRLANRERQVCLGIVDNRSDAEIAKRLGVALSSVITYRRRAYAKLAIGTRSELFKLVLSCLMERKEAMFDVGYLPCNKICNSISPNSLLS